MPILNNIDTLIKEAKQIEIEMLSSNKYKNLRENPDFKEIGTGPAGTLFQHKNGSFQFVNHKGE